MGLLCTLDRIAQHTSPSSQQAFGINLYNLMIEFACLKMGVLPADNEVARDTFYSSIKFNIGGHLYSFKEWEHGILRGNAKAPYGSYVPFAQKDPRYQFVVKQPDPRIHFALNCGTSSCPPVYRYSAENLNDELAVAATSFCEDDRNVNIDHTKCEILVSKIFYWYRGDFADKSSNLPKLLSSYMQGTKKQTLDLMLDNVVKKSNVKVVFLPQDWSPSTCAGAIAFDPEMLKTERKGRGMLNLLSAVSPMRSPSKRSPNKRSPDKRSPSKSSPDKVSQERRDPRRRHALHAAQQCTASPL